MLGSVAPSGGCGATGTGAGARGAPGAATGGGAPEMLAGAGAALIRPPGAGAAVGSGRPGTPGGGIGGGMVGVFRPGVREPDILSHPSGMIDRVGRHRAATEIASCAHEDRRGSGQTEPPDTGWHIEGGVGVRDRDIELKDAKGRQRWQRGAGGTHPSGTGRDAGDGRACEVHVCSDIPVARR